MKELTAHVVEIHGKRILLLKNFIEAQTIPAPPVADVWLINHTEREKVKRFLRTILRSSDIRTYLKPIFIDDESELFLHNDSAIIQHLSDGFWRNTDALKLATLIEQVEHYINDHNDRSDDKMDTTERILQYIFDHAYTRRNKIIPLRQQSSLTGYAYPRLDSFFFNIEDAYMNSRVILKEAEEKGYLKREYFDTQHLCRDCSGGFLNYREVCPKCHKHNLKATNLIHHFRCAYLGPETDFAFNNKLICPKCSTQLKNVGVDYDRPGKMFTCKNSVCDHQFQDAPISVGCVHCGLEQAPHELVVKKVYQYSLAEMGLHRFVWGRKTGNSQTIDTGVGNDA